MRLSLSPAIVALLAAANPAFAQANRPIAPIVIDARAFTVGFGADEITANDLAITLDELAGRGFGVVAGANVYPIRRAGFAIGAAVEALIARGARTNHDAGGTVVLSEVERKLQSLAGGFTLNFGHRDGFSYVTAGMGPMLFQTSTAERPPGPSPAREMTLNFGGGARWFNSAHLAFGFDVRFYETKPVNATATSPGRERRRLLVMSAGISVR